jgi:uncharacterized protein YbgA (DUF1722 family)
MGNEDQDTVAILEKCADVDKRKTRLLEAKGYFKESTEVRRWQRYMNEVKKWEDSRLPLVGGCMILVATVWTRSSVIGTKRSGVSCARGRTR